MCIKFNSKGNCDRNCSRSNAYLQGQTLADYILFLDQWRSWYEARKDNRKRKSMVDGSNFIDRWQGQQQNSKGGRLERHWVGEWRNRETGIDNAYWGENVGDRGGNGNIPNPTHTPNRQRYSKNRDDSRSVWTQIIRDGGKRWVTKEWQGGVEKYGLINKTKII